MRDKVVIITGASSGIGKALAYELAHQGAKVVLAARNIEELLHIEQDLRQQGAEVLSVRTDVTKELACKELIEQAYARFGRIDALINNAGISHIGLLQDMNIDEWNNVINTNLTSVFSCCKYAIPYMVAQKQGKIINISSMWGVSGASCEVAYSASKGGVNLFTKALAKELAPSNIQVNAIACGVIDTRMNACFDDEERTELENEIPAGRFAAPGEVAEMILKLIEAPDYLTGQVITFDGGYL